MLSMPGVVPEMESSVVLGRMHGLFCRRYAAVHSRSSQHLHHGVRYGGGQGAMPPQFLEKINEFLNFTIDF